MIIWTIRSTISCQIIFSSITTAHLANGKNNLIFKNVGSPWIFPFYMPAHWVDAFCQEHCNPHAYPELLRDDGWCSSIFNSLILQLQNRQMSGLEDTILCVGRCMLISTITSLMKWLWGRTVWQRWSRPRIVWIHTILLSQHRLTHLC